MLGDSPKNRRVSTNKDKQMIMPNKQYETILKILEISFIMFSPKLSRQEVNAADGKTHVFQVGSSRR